MDMKEELTHIMVVDDDDFVNELLGEILAFNGYTVRSAKNGKEALEIFGSGSDIDLIISDMNMPEMNGLDLIRELRANHTDIPIIILTSNSEISIALKAIKSGANDYLLKDENIEDTIILSAQKVYEKHVLKKQNIRLMADLAQKNEELERSNRELIELNELKNKFLGIAAHDIRNPLSAIRGFVEMLMEEDQEYVTEEERQEYVTIIYNTTNEMINLLNDLLDVSVIESGKLEIEPVKGSLKTLIEERIRLSRVVAGKKGIIIHQHLENVPPVAFDSNRISQVFENLISNAIKFSPRDSGIHIYLSAGEDTVRVSVKDEGPGLPREEFDKLFDVYERLSVKPTGGEKSTGLGLSIVKKVIDAHRGQVEVESEVGSGSTFSFVLPID